MGTRVGGGGEGGCSISVIGMEEKVAEATHIGIMAFGVF